ncbi:MAG: type II toxin-antitoxin system RelE/ParE family toxin [Methanobacteriota archaeon]|nr:MAG: type II toxin-antitoxin system RelE/ParE family toxin [Euryarchaeota archaeon]
MYGLALRKSVEKIFRKLVKKNPKQLDIIHKRVEEIRKNPHHYKNLRRPLQHLKRVRVDKSFVLVFSVDDSEKVVVIEDYDHHDNIYKL